MAAAEPDLQPVKRSNSLELIPPSMSELRVVLLGGNWSQRSSVGNFILGCNGFNKSLNTFKKISAELEEKQISVINSPDVSFSTAEKLTEFIRKCAEVSDPGPHVFLLVLHPESFTRGEKDKICRILQDFSDRSFDHSLVLILKPGLMARFLWQHPIREDLINDLIRKCRYRNLKMEETEREQLLIRFGQIARENNENHVRYEDFVETATTLPSDHQTQKRPASRPAAVKPKSRGEQILPPLNLVLFGPSEPLKTAAAKVILGHKDLPSECVRKQGEVFGRGVSLVELPALYGKAEQEVMEESFRCVSLCDPEGVHAFILVLPVGPLTDEDKGELHTIQDTFSSRVNDFTIILFTTELDPEHPDVIKLIKRDKDIQDLIKRCQARYFVLNIRDRRQIKELMETVCGEKSSVFSTEMFTKVLIERILKVEAELQDVKQKSEDEQQSTKQLRKETEEVKKQEEELKKKHREETKSLQSQLEQQRKQQIQMLKEKVEIIENEREKRKKEREEEDKRWRKQEELQRKEWKQKLDASENRVKVEREQREAAERRLDQSRRDRTRDRDAWDKEKVGILDRMHQDLKQNLQETKQNLEEERERNRKLQEDFYLKRRKWTYLGFTLLLSVTLVLLYVYQSH